MDWESSAERHEARGFTYIYTHGFDEAIFSCDTCGSLVRYFNLDQHRNWHSILNVMINQQMARV